MGAGCPVAAPAITVTAQLPADRRGRPADPLRDPAHRRAGRTRQGDLLPLGETQAAALQVPSTARPHPARRRDPAGTLLPVRPRHPRRVGDELTALHRSPERLHNLRHHGLSEPGHRNSPILWCVAITARTRGSPYGQRADWVPVGVALDQHHLRLATAGRCCRRRQHGQLARPTNTPPASNRGSRQQPALGNGQRSPPGHRARARMGGHPVTRPHTLREGQAATPDTSQRCAGDRHT